MQITSSSNAMGHLPSSAAPVIAKLAIDQMLVQQLSMMTTGSLMPSGLGDVKVSLHPPVKTEADSYIPSMVNADGTAAAGTTAAAVRGTNSHYAAAAQGGFDLFL